MSILKNLGKSVLWVLAIPAFVVGMAIFSVYGIIIFFVETIKKFFLFITGRRLDDKLSEDAKGRDLLTAELNPVPTIKTVSAEYVNSPQIPEPSQPSQSIPTYGAQVSQQIPNHQNEQIDMLFNDQIPQSKHIDIKTVDPFASLDNSQIEMQEVQESIPNQHETIQPSTIETEIHGFNREPIPEKEETPEPIGTYNPKTSNF